MSRHGLTALSRIIGSAPSATSASAPADGPYAYPQPPESAEDKRLLAEQILAAGAKARQPISAPQPSRATEEDNERVGAHDPPQQKTAPNAHAAKGIKCLF